MTPDSGEAILRANGSTYRLAMKTAALSALQKRLSPPGQLLKLDTLVKEMSRRLMEESIDHVVVFVWAALQKHHPGTTEDEAMGIIDDAGGITALTPVFTELASSMSPDPADLKELSKDRTNGNPRKARARKTSGGNSSSAHV